MKYDDVVSISNYFCSCSQNNTVCFDEHQTFYFSFFVRTNERLSFTLILRYFMNGINQLVMKRVLESYL